MRIEYMNWTQEKILCHTDRKYRKGNEYAYRIYELYTRNFYVTLIEKCRRGNEYAYRIY